jgi:5-methylcytosine-specific restriction endonuclease McrA
LGWAKLRLLARVCEPASEARWLGLAREMSVTQLARVVSAYRRASETDRPERHADAHERRGIWLFDEPDGLVRITGLLEADDAAVLRAALGAYAELLWREAAVPEDQPDDQTLGDAEQPDAEEARSSEVDPTEATRQPAASGRADALVAMAQTALAAGPTPCIGGERTQVIVHVDADVLAGIAEVGRCHTIGGPALATDTARRLACDATIRPLVIRKADGTPLDVGRAHRLVNRQQRRALEVRDGGCAFPGCACTLYVDAHHIHHWANGGRTDLDNLVLLCRHHHRLLHEGGYRIRMIDGRPRFHRPDGTTIGRPRTRDRPPRPLTGRRPVTRHTPRARSGGAPHWSPAHALDGLLSA